MAIKWIKTIKGNNNNNHYMAHLGNPLELLQLRSRTT